VFAPEEMKDFCSTHAPGLFELLYNTIKNDEKGPTSTKRERKQEIRVVSLLHTMCFYRNQVMDCNYSNIIVKKIITKIQNS